MIPMIPAPIAQEVAAIRAAELRDLGMPSRRRRRDRGRKGRFLPSSVVGRAGIRIAIGRIGMTAQGQASCST